MKNLILGAALAFAFACSAQAKEWQGVGEFGLAITSGNTDTQNINARLDLSKETNTWKHEFDLDFLQAKGPTTRDRFVPLSPGSRFLLLNREIGNYKVAQRYEASWTSGYKLSETSYVFGNVRYENDEFGAYDNQTVAGIGYGFYVIKQDPTKLLFEMGAGYRRAQKQDEYEQLATAGATPPFPYVRNRFDKQGEGIVRGKMKFRHELTENTDVYNRFLIEAGSDNTFMQNDLGLAVKMSDAFAVKVGFQVRRNSEVSNAVSKTDRLFTTNLAYSF